MDVMKKNRISDEAYDSKIEEMVEKMEILIDISFYIQGGYILPDANKDIDILQKLDEAREAMAYINNLCDEHHQEHVYPDPYYIVESIKK